MKLFLFSIIILLFTACSSNQTDPRNIKQLVIIGTNDFHGYLDPIIEDPYTLGGAEVMAAYVNILKEKYKDELLLLDAGDSFAGTLLSNYFHGVPTTMFYNYLNYDALTMGNHEFDFGIKFLNENMKKSKAPYISSNIIHRNGGMTFTLPFIIKKINKVKVAIIGMCTLETPHISLKENVKGLYFANMKKTLLDTSKQVKSLGAQVTILLVHDGKKALKRLIKSVPPNTIDAVASGHTHKLIDEIVENVPLIQSGSKGRYLGRIDLFYDLKLNRILKERTLIHPPIKLCDKFYAETNDCLNPPEGSSPPKMVPATFLGKEIIKDSKVTALLANHRRNISKKRDQFIVNLEKKITRSKEGISELGTMVADAMRWMTKADVAITNSGGVRTDLPKGKVTYGDVYQAVPFENYLITMPISGKLLKELIIIGNSRKDVGIGNFSGLKIVITDDNYLTLPQKDLNHNGKIDPFEVNRVIKATMSDGTPIKDDKIYTLTTQNFLGLTGGDMYGHIFNQIQNSDKKGIPGLTYRGALIKYLKHLKDFLKKGESYLKHSKSKLIIEK